MMTKDIEALIRLRDAFRMAAEALDEYIDTFAPKEDTRFNWNPDKIKWIQVEGTSGPYERSEDITNPEFQAMLKDLNEHKGKFTREGYFYWVFAQANIVGRKKKA